MRYIITILSLFLTIGTFAQSSNGEKWYDKIVRDYNSKMQKISRPKARSNATKQVTKAKGRVIRDPYYGESTCNYMNVRTVVFDDKFTLVHGFYRNDDEDGSVNISKGTYLKDCITGCKYLLLHAEGIPMAPETKNFEKVGEVIEYILFFQPLPKSTLLMDMVEPSDMDSGHSFEFHEINTSGLRHFKYE